MVVFAANAGCAPPHAVGRGTSSSTPRLVGGCGFNEAESKFMSPVPRGPRAVRPVENQPSAHGACARWRSWRGCLCGQRGARYTPRRWPRLFFTDTAPGRRLRFRNAANKAFEIGGARPARASPRGEPAIRPWSMRALAELAWLSLRPTRGTLHPAPLAEALLHRHRARSAAAVSERRKQSFQNRWRTARTRFAPWRTSRPPTEHVRAGGLGVVIFAANAGRAPPHVRDAVIETSEFRGARHAHALPREKPADRPQSTCTLADLARLSSRANARRASPHAVGRGSSSPTPRQVGGYGFEATYPKLPDSVPRGTRVVRPRKSGRPPTEHTRAGGLRVVVFAASAGRAPPHAVGRGSSSTTPRQVGGCGFKLS